MTSLEKLNESIRMDLDLIREELNKFTTEHGVPPMPEKEALYSSLDDIEEALDNLMKDTRRTHETGLLALAASSVAAAQIDSLDSSITYAISARKIVHTISTSWQKLKSYIETKIKAISAKLWQLISQLLNLKEWSISGETGVNLFGLSGKVEIQITFEP